MEIMLVSSKNKNPMIYFDLQQLKLSQIQKMGGLKFSKKMHDNI